MPRKTRTKIDRKQDEARRHTSEKQLRRLEAELKVEWRSGRTTPTDTITFIRTVEQWHLRRKRRQARRLLQKRPAAA
jgi:hypothetical protein